MSTYAERAGELQRGVKYDELENLDKGLDQYQRPAVRQAIVHTRQDMVMLVSLLDSVNVQLRALRWTAFLFLVSFWLYWWRG